MMQREVPGLSDPLDPSDWRKLLPHLRDAMEAVAAEVTAGGDGGRLAADGVEDQEGAT